jgi:TonB family protein
MLQPSLIERVRLPQALAIALLLHLFLGLLLFLGGDQILAFAMLEPEPPAVPETMRFTFVDLPDEVVVDENPDAPFWSDENREARSEEPPETAAEESDLPYSEGNTDMVEITPAPSDGAAEVTPPPEPEPEPEPEPVREVQEPVEQETTTTSAASDPLEGPGPEADPAPEPAEPNPEPQDDSEVRDEQLLQALRDVSQYQPKGFDTKFDQRKKPKVSEFGGLSFETKDYDWGDYGRRLVEIIRANWRIPMAVRMGETGQCTFRFTIERDGFISSIEMVSTSDKAALDNAAEQALEASNPLPPLPANFPNASERVTVRFLYNLRIDR